MLSKPKTMYQRKKLLVFRLEYQKKKFLSIIYAIFFRYCGFIAVTLPQTLLLYMCFDRFLLAFESRDLSQAYKRITRVSSFPSFNFWLINYSYTRKSYLKIWQNCFGHFITQKFASLKSKQFSQFFLVRGKSERIDKIHFAESLGLRPERQKKKFHCSSLSLGKKTLL